MFERGQLSSSELLLLLLLNISLLLLMSVYSSQTTPTERTCLCYVWQIGRQRTARLFGGRLCRCAQHRDDRVVVGVGVVVVVAERCDDDVVWRIVSPICVDDCCVVIGENAHLRLFFDLSLLSEIERTDFDCDDDASRGTQLDQHDRTIEAGIDDIAMFGANVESATRSSMT